MHLLGMSMAAATAVVQVLLARTTARRNSWWGEGTADTGLVVAVRGARLHLLVLLARAQAQRGQGAREQGEEGRCRVVHRCRRRRRIEGVQVRRPRLHRCKGLIHVLWKVAVTRKSEPRKRVNICVCLSC